MLDKRICKRCRRESSWWNKFDETRWKSGEIICVVGTIKNTKKHEIAKRAPEHCPYILEHIVQLPSKKRRKSNGRRRHSCKTGK